LAQSHTHAIQTLTGQISRLVGTLEAEQDYQNCRKLVDDAVRQASETRTTLMRIREHQHQAQNPAEMSNRRMMYNKLSDNLAITARVLEDVVRRFTAAERKHFAAVEDASQSVAAGDAAGGHQSVSLLHEEKADCTSSVASVEKFDEELQQERSQTLRRVDEDMRCLQHIYRDLANTADQQQGSFDSLESHMAWAAADVERGRDEIDMSRYNVNGRMRQRLLAGVGGVLTICLIGSLMSWS